MGKGTSTSQQQTSQTSDMSGTTAPWEPTQGLLQNIIGGIGGQIGNYQPNSAETGALNTIQANAANTPNYAPQATSFANDLMTGGKDRTGILTDSYAQTQAALSPYLSASYLDPMQNPGMRGYLDTIKSDIGNTINSQFAGAGRDLSGMNTQTLARGLSQGLSGAILGQYNQNVQNQMNAASGLSSAAGNTTAALSGLDQQALANRAQGLDVGINGVPQAQNAGAYAALDAQNLSRNLPLQNLGMLSSLLLPIAGLGSQTTGKSSGTGTSTGEYTMSPAQQAWGWMNSGGNLFKNLGFGGR